MPFRRMAFRWKRGITCKCFSLNVGEMNARDMKRPGYGAKVAKCMKNKTTHRKAGNRLAGRLVIVDNTDASLATSVVIKKPESVILVLWNYGDGQNRISGARQGVSEAGVKPIDGDVCLMCRDARITESRFSCRVVPGRDCGTDQITTHGQERNLQLKMTTSPRAATTL